MYWEGERVHSRRVKEEIDWVGDANGLPGSKCTHGERQGLVQLTREAGEGGCQQLVCEERRGEGACEEQQITANIFKVRIWTLP